MLSRQKNILQIAAVAKEPVAFGGKVWSAPASVVVTEAFWRRYACAVGCGGCCGPWSLDYLPAEWARATHAAPRLAEVGIQVRRVVVNGVEREVVSVRQGVGKWCRFLEGVRCGVYDGRPLSCRVEPLKVRRMKGKGYIFKGPFPRAWAMRGVDGEAVRCERGEMDWAQLAPDLDVLARLEAWADWWGIATWLPEVMVGVRAVAALGRPVRLEFGHAGEAPS
jgi:Fe-S-cluster containining protein